MNAMDPERPDDRASLNGVATPGRTSHDALLPEALRLLRSLPKAAKTTLRERPTLAVGIVAVGSFGIGILVGSKVTRALLLAALSAGASQLVHRAAAGKIDKYVSPLVHQGIRSAANAIERMARG